MGGNPDGPNGLVKMLEASLEQRMALDLAKNSDVSGIKEEDERKKRLERAAAMAEAHKSIPKDRWYAALGTVVIGSKPECSDGATSQCFVVMVNAKPAAAAAA